MFPSKVGSIIPLLFIHWIPIISQQVVTLESIITMALEQSPLIKAGKEQLIHDRFAEKSAGNIPDPEFLIESPTGNFMTLGVQQTIEFPTVYSRRKQLARQQSILSEKAQFVSETELIWKVKSAYLEWQYAIAKLVQQEQQDSIYYKIVQGSSRQYQAGQIDFVEKSFADAKYTEVHTKLISSRAEVQNALQQLQAYTGIPDNSMPTALVKTNEDNLVTGYFPDSTTLNNTPILDYYRQTQTIAEKAIQLEKDQVLPDFTFGYLNQADPNTSIPQRLRFGISIPLWFWQYKSSINAAKSNLEIARHNADYRQQDLTLQWYDAKNNALKYQAMLSYYETEGIRQSDEMIEATNRMFTAGEYDYLRYLSVLSYAYQIHQQYLETLLEYNQSINQLQYLIGQ